MMLTNYLKMAWRNLLKNKLSSIINIAGLSLAVGCCIFTYVYGDFYYNRDNFHENLEKIYLIRSVLGENAEQELWANSPVALGPAVATDFPQVERSVRIAEGYATVKLGEKVFDESLWFVDDGFLDMFTFPLKYGQKEALQANNNLILSEKMAIKYFGDIDPVGKSLYFKFPDNQTASFLVGGVAREISRKSSFEFNMLINYGKQRELSEDLNSWARKTKATFIQVNDAAQIGDLAAGMYRYIGPQNSADPDRPLSAFRFEPLTTMAKNTYLERGGIVQIPLYPGQMMNLIFLALSFLLLATFNYVNITIASATRRFKEIGIRKVVGSNRSQLIKQFLGENVLVCFVAFMLGVLLAELIITPGFNNLWGIFDLRLDYTGSIQLWLFFAALLLVTSIGSGVWPAFFISSFQPANIVKGSLKFGGKNRFTKVLLGFQFLLSFLIITNSVVFIQNSNYMRRQDWGYNQEQLLILPVETASQYKVLENEIGGYQGVLRTAGAIDRIGRANTNVVVEIAEKEFEVVQFRIGFDYFETMGLRLAGGRIFNEDQDTDRQESIMVNQTFVKTLGWQDAIGKVVIQNDHRYKVIGVFDDFRTPDHFMSRIEPMMLRVLPDEDLTCLVAKISAGNSVQTAKFVQEAWHRLMPERPYTGYFQDEIFNEIFQAMDGITTSSLFVGAIALVMTCMGIFGLVSLNIAKRTRELSIRKVLGANVSQVISLINRGFVNVLIVATVIAMPVNYFASKAFLSMFTDHVPLGWIPFAIAFGLVLFTAVATICSGVYKAAVANPVDALRA